MPRLSSDSLSNQNISSALLVKTFTAGQNYSSLMFQIFLDQIAGGGDYKIYLTHQITGIGSEYKTAVTTDSLAVGETSHKFGSIQIPANNTDVIRIYVQGLTGDTTTPDITVEVWDLAVLTPTVQGRTLNVSATGEADISAGAVDLIWDEPLTGATHNVSTSAGRRLRQLAGNIVIDGTAVGAGVNGNQIILDSTASSVDGSYDPSLIAIVSGTGAGQCRLILQYEGATKLATVDRTWRVLPDATSDYIIYADAGREHVNEGLARGGTINTIRLNSDASVTDNEYAGQLIFIRSGVGEDQVGLVSTYDGTTKWATVSRDWGIIPDTTSAYVVLPAKANLPADNAVAVWSHATRTLSSYGTLIADIWNYVRRTLTSSTAISSTDVGRYGELSQEPGVLNITMVHDDDLSFDLLLNLDVTNYDYFAEIQPLGGGTPIVITVTATDVATGNLHFYISDTSIATLAIVKERHKWYFKLSTPKQETPPITTFERTILAGYLNLI
ncbi:MAG: hypothetical protein WA061_02240 [Microgenomates group bacterium]